MQPVEPLPYDESKWRRVLFADERPEYNPLVALVDHLGVVVQTRWAPTSDERRAILDGACISLTTMVFGQPLQPVILEVEGAGELIEMPPMGEGR